MRFGTVVLVNASRNPCAGISGAIVPDIAAVISASKETVPLLASYTAGSYAFHVALSSVIT